MNLCIINFLLICLLFWRTIAIPDRCTRAQYMVNSEEIVAVSCQQAELNDIPQDLPKHITLLEITIDMIRELKATSFAKYPKIKYLKLRSLGIGMIEDGSFLALKNLKNLDLSGNLIEVLPPLPSNLEMISLNQMYKDELFASHVAAAHLAELKSLKSISLRRNRLERVPKFVTELKTLTVLDVGGNQINQLTLEDIAPLCNLETLNFTGNVIKQEEKAACQCIGVQKWASLKKIRVLDLKCPEIRGIDKNKCEKDFEKEAERIYSECKVRTLIWKYIFIIGGILIGLAILILWCCWSSFKWRKSNRNKRRTSVSSFRKEETEKPEESVKFDGIAI